MISVDEVGFVYADETHRLQALSKFFKHFCREHFRPVGKIDVGVIAAGFESHDFFGKKKECSFRCGDHQSGWIILDSLVYHDDYSLLVYLNTCILFFLRLSLSLLPIAYCLLVY